MIRIQRALISVFNKEGVADFARALSRMGIEIISTGATGRALVEGGVEIVPVEEISSFPELFDGRLKTLTPQIHGGLLMRRERAEDREQAERFGIRPIDLLCVNLYPFRETVARCGADRDACIEMIDIGGPAMVRAAAKNHRHVVVISSPEQYAGVVDLMAANDGSFPEEQAARLAAEAFGATAAYDAAIFDYLWREDLGMPQHWAAGGRMLSPLRYGENPSQRASCYVGTGDFWHALEQHQGKALSYNNLADLWAAWRCLGEFGESACVVIKHATPSGVALAESPTVAFERARDGDALSAFGGVVLFNRPCDDGVAALLGEMFLEIVAAPRWEGGALEVLSKKKNLRVLTLPETDALSERGEPYVFKSLGEATLVQTPMLPASGPAAWECVAGEDVAPAVLEELFFAWRIVRHVRSNAIALTRERQTIGLGAGQTSRIDAMDAALLKARRSNHSTDGAVLASDAFFPFRDVVDRAAENGVRAIVQPGGSRRDKESIAACREHGIAMFFTGERVFVH